MTITYATPLGLDADLLKGVAADPHDAPVPDAPPAAYVLTAHPQGPDLPAVVARLAWFHELYPSQECPLPVRSATPRDPVDDARVRRLRGTYAFIAGRISRDEYSDVLASTRFAYPQDGSGGMGSA
jgi:hypothetical protein